MFDLEKAVAAWRRTLHHRRAFLREDLDELESHLRDHVERLVAQGQPDEEAFRSAVRRMGDYGSIEAEYRKVFWLKLKHKRALLRELIWEVAMLKNYVKVTLRNLKKHPGSSFINVSGLAIGMACCLVVLLYVRDEVRFDRYHDNADRLYRLSIYATTLSTGESGNNAASSILWGPALQRDFPDVERYARFVRLVNPNNPWVLRHGENAFEETGLLHADAAALELFSWPLRQGDPATALVEPNSIVVTRSMANKYFGDADPMGKVLTIDPRLRDDTGVLTGETADFVVTGVLEDVPRTSHFTFDFLIGVSHLNAVYGGDVTTGDGMDRWFWRGRIAYTYLLLATGADPAALEAKLPDFLDRYVGDETRSRGYDYDLFLQPLPDIYLDGNFTQQLAPVGSLRNITMFSIVAAFILLIACINFMNLATARSAQRAKEVGLRKVVGAQRRQLVAQFLGESVIISLVALAVGVVLARLIMPIFCQYLGKEVVFDYASLFFVASLAGVAVLVGLVAGSYPAFFLSRFQPASVLKGTFESGSKGSLLRKGLVVFQFVISVFLIIGTITVYQQLRYMQRQDLGFEQERVLFLPPQVAMPLRASYDAVRGELLEHPQVADVTLATALPGVGGSGDIYVERGKPADEGFSMAEGYVDYNFLDFFGLDLVTGRDFSREITSDAGYMAEDSSGLVLATILNEEAVRQFGWASPEEALGKEVIRDPRSVDFIGHVIGVVKDFHVESLQQPISPVAIVLAPESPRPAFLAVRLQSGEAAAALAHIERTVRQFQTEASFDYAFLDETFRAQYEGEQRLGEIFAYISFLAIFIACMGLFGLAAFMAERRTKEIGVRKVLGASASGIVALLSKEFLQLVLIAFVVAIPLGYFVADRWLQEFAYRIDVGPGIFVLAGSVALLIALLTVGYQSVRAALADPVESLRYE